MYLSELKLYNFRRFLANDDQNPGLIVHFHKGLNIIVGENDSGKTAIIDAIRLMVGEVSDDFQRINEDDFYCNDSGNYENAFRIEGRFCDLSDREAGIFMDWLSFDNQNQYELCLTLSVEHKTNDNGQVYIDHKLVAGAKGSELPLASSARSFLKATYLKPLRNAKDELTPGFRSHLPKMLMAHSIFNSDDENRDDLVNIMRGANTQIENFFGGISYKADGTVDESERRPSLNDELSSVLSHFYDKSDRDKSNISLQLPEANLTQILKQLSLNPNSKNLGLGNMNLLYIATELALLDDHLSHTVYGPNIMLVEELEAHLHVQAQIRLIKYIEKYLTSHQATASMQFILTSHSISLTSSVDQKLLIYMNNGRAYSMDPQYTMLDESGYGFLNRFLDATKANLFFAKGLIYVEGYAENILLPELAELIGYSLHENGISIVNIGSRGFENFVRLFARRDTDEEISVPIAIIRDSDVRPYAYRINEENRDNVKALLDENGEIDKEYETINFPTFNSLQKKFKLGFESSKLEELSQTTYQLLESAELAKFQSEARDKLQSEYEDLHVNQRVFVSPAWTLEYSLLKSPLYDLLVESIREVHFTAGSTKEKKFEKENHKSDLVNFYQWFERNVSKAETAQSLAEHIHNLSATAKEKLKNEVLKDKYCAYLINAIKFACGEGGKQND